MNEKILKQLNLTAEEYNSIMELTGEKPENICYFKIEEVEDDEQECSCYPPNTHEEIFYKVKGDDALYIV
jgi:hypothetical protein